MGQSVEVDQRSPYAVVRNGSFGAEAMQILGKYKGAHKRSVDSASVDLDAVVEE